MAIHSTAAGATFSIGTTQTDPTTDTYVNVALITQVPEFGRIYNEVKFAPLSSRGVLKSKGSYDDGSVGVQLAKDLSDAGQAAMLVARDSDLDYNFKVVANDAIASATATVTITIAAPGVVSWTGHGLPAGTAVKFSTTGALPTGITAGTTYYVASGATLLTDSFTISTSFALAIAGTSITTTGSQSGVQTGLSVPAATYMTFKAKVLSFTTKFDNVDAVIMSTCNVSIKSGSIAEQRHLP